MDIDTHNVHEYTGHYGNIKDVLPLLM